MKQLPMFKIIAVLCAIFGVVVLYFGIKGFVDLPETDSDQTGSMIAAVVPSLFFWTLAVLFWRKATQPK